MIFFKKPIPKNIKNINRIVDILDKLTSNPDRASFISKDDIVWLSKEGNIRFSNYSYWFSGPSKLSVNDTSLLFDILVKKGYIVRSTVI
jgi:hypothetical protein